jgi:hypothetical protein
MELVSLPVSSGFPLPIIPPLVHTNPLPPPEVYYSPDQAAQYHILGIEARGFISDQTAGWLWRKEANPVINGCNQILEPLALQVKEVMTKYGRY